MLPILALIAGPVVGYLSSLSTKETDDERTIDAIMRLDALHKAVLKEGITKLEKIAAFHAQAMTIHTLLSAQFLNDGRRRKFSADFDKLLHSYNFE